VNIYENVVIFNASLSDEEIEGSAQKIRDLIAGSGGEVLKTEAWGRRKLGYAINKHTRGFYTLLLFRAPSEVIKKLEDYFRVFDPVVKSMVVKLEKKQKEAALKALAPAPASGTAPAGS
jgi:small subunit ribosomal protein S6